LCVRQEFISQPHSSSAVPFLAATKVLVNVDSVNDAILVRIMVTDSLAVLPVPDPTICTAVSVGPLLIDLIA
jgi:hypothetical protein